MEVVKSNFMRVLPILEDVIKRSVFIAIDTEFTGLSVCPNAEPSLFDSLSERYSKVRSTAGNYMICQIGLSAYLKDSSNNGYVAHSFNFYLFPKEQGQHNPTFGIQASNMEFLCKHNFDFNKWIYEGIPYCNAKEEDQVLYGLDANSEHQCIEAMGFRHVFNLLVQAKKPILGHNLLLDIAYIFDKFDKPLRQVLDDNKLFNSTCLEEVYELVKSQQFSHRTLYNPIIKHSKESFSYKNSSRFHEAGFDAYCVGFIFLRLAHFMSMRKIKSIEATPIHYNQYMKVMQQYVNTINLPRGPLRYINLAGPDPVIKKRGLLVLKTIDGSPINIEMIKSKCEGSIDIQLVQPNYALIAVVSLTMADQIKNYLAKNDLHRVRHYSWIRDASRSKLISWGIKRLLLPSISVVLALSFYRIWTVYFL